MEYVYVFVCIAIFATFGFLIGSSVIDESDVAKRDDKPRDYN